MQQLGLGIIGLGVGRGALLLNRDSESPIAVRAVADLDSERLEQATGEYGVAFATTDYRELLERPDVDVVGVFTPDHLHGEHLPAALEAGKHVICTKPLATTLQDCENVVGLVRRTGLKFVVAQTWRFIPHIVALKQAVDSGRIGRINLIETGYIHDIRSVCERTPWRVTVPQNFLFGGGAHAIDCLRWFAGNVVEVSAFARKSEVIPGYPIEDIWILNLIFESGALGRVLVMCGSVNNRGEGLAGGNKHLQIYGTEGTITGIDIGIDENPEHTTLEVRPPQIAGALIEGHAAELAPYFYKMVEWIKNDETPDPDVVEGARGIAVAVAAQESLKTGRAVKVRNGF